MRKKKYLMIKEIKSVKLFADFFKIFDLKSPDKEIKAISGLIFNNQDI